MTALVNRDVVRSEVPQHYVRVPCDICGAAPAEPFLAKWGGFYSRCPECGYIYSNPRHPDPSEYNESHNESMKGFYIGKQYSRRHQRKYTRILRTLSPFRQNGRILEVGCSTGGFCWRAQQLGWQAIGIEPVAAVAQVGRQRGLDIRCTTLEAAAFPDNHFDVVFSNAVIEHLPSPKAVLQECWRVLRPGGVIYADTVNIDCYTWNWLGAEWKLVDPRAHLGLFTPQTLRRLCNASGYEVLQVSSHGVRFRRNGDRPLQGLARWWEEVRKFPWALAAQWTLQGESIAVLARKPVAAARAAA